MTNAQKPRLLRQPLILLFIVISLTLTIMFRGDFQPTVRAASTFVVTNVNDSGAGSLRQAIIDANSNPGTDTITFSIGSGHKTITPLQRLPTLTDPVVIDGTTQPGYSGTPIIELDGSVQPDGNGLGIAGGNSTVRGLVINRFHFDGIAIGFNGGNRIEGCYIGTDVTGMVALPNGSNGISIPSSNNVIGGPSLATRNVISGNIEVGIDISRFCCSGNETPITGNVIQGNYIGVNAAGNAAIPNRNEGITINSFNANVPVTGNIVGGTQPGAGNVISGNRGNGLELDGFHVRNNTVQGNFIGTDVTGTFAIPNDGHGLIVTGSDNLIGGAETGARNVVSGNGCFGSGCTQSATGVVVGIGSGNVVKGNIIGANAALTAPIPNTGHGLTVGGTNNVIGGTAAGEANVIAFNGFNGISDNNPSSTNNSLRGNAVFSNGLFSNANSPGIGIDLGGSGVTPNDAGDGDAGTNNLQNFPVITSVTPGANSFNVKGTLNSQASTSFTLDFYANSVCDPSGFGEGARHIGSNLVTTNSGGDAAFDINFPVTLPTGHVLTATATDPAGNTSEFSQCSATSQSGGSIAFSTSFVTVSEAAGTATFVLNRVGGSAGSLTVNYTVFSQTATAGQDFVPTTGTFTFADGETSKTFTVPIIDDNLDEALSEIAKVALSTSGFPDTLGSQSTVTLTITDNDPLPSLTVGNAVAAEGNSGTTSFNFPVTLSQPSGRTVTLNYEVVDGTATVGTDFLQAPNTTIVIPAGQTTATITVQVLGDTAIEQTETFFINLFPVNASVADFQVEGIIVDDDGPSSLQFSSQAYDISEGGIRAVITVTRTGSNLTGSSTIDYATSNGTANQVGDYTTTSGTLTFAPGEVFRTFSVIITNDVYLEDTETINLTLSNPTGTIPLGTPAVATLSIFDNEDDIPSNNPIDDARFFVRQNYADFLSRVPDQGGLDYWTQQITQCGTNVSCINFWRSAVSAAFFIELEFQNTGSFVYRLYQASYGVRPTYSQFTLDRARVVDSPNLEQSKQSFAELFVQRPEFIAKYGASSACSDLTDALLASVKNGSGVDLSEHRFDLIGECNTYAGDVKTQRARVLRKLIEYTEFVQAEYNKAFVLMQYFGFLRRNPDEGGYQFWLGVVNNSVPNDPSGYRSMVCAFITSPEYQQRFSPIVTRDDTVCAPQ